MSTTSVAPKLFTGCVSTFLVPCTAYIVDGHIVDLQIDARTERVRVTQTEGGLFMEQVERDHVE